MTCLSKNSFGNLYGKSVCQRSNVPTKGHINIYNVLFHYFMFLSLRWNVVFLLEHVGTRFHFFPVSVGTLLLFQQPVKMFQQNNYYLISTH
jgi:hypothetical protein